MSGFSSDQLKKLLKGLDTSRIQSREINGRQIDYIEGWFAIAEANAIFGYAGWDREMVHFDRVFERVQPRGTDCAYCARVRIRVRAGNWLILREGTGFGYGFATSLADAHERALKAAETDATKRALATFGSRFGLSLYDKEQNPAMRASKAREERESSSYSPNATELPRDDGPVSTLQLGNIFELKTEEGSVLAASLSPEGFCSGLRQLTEAARTVLELEGLTLHNAEALSALRTNVHQLKNAQGKHYADILAALMQKRRHVLLSAITADLGNGESVARVLPKPIPLTRSSIAPTAPVRPAPEPFESNPVSVVSVLPGAVSSAPDAPALASSAHLSAETILATSGSPLSAAPAAAAPVSVSQPSARSLISLQSAVPVILPEPSAAQKPLSEQPGLDQPRSDHPCVDQPAKSSRIGNGPVIDKSVLLLASPRRIRNKAHLARVASEPCLICEQGPSHAHHITFAQPRGLSVKVSDEFTVPLCALHHNDLHRAGNEAAWWRKVGADPLIAALALWQVSLGSVEGRPSGTPGL